MNKKVKLINILFILLIIFSVLSYIVQSTQLIITKQFGLWTIKDNDVGIIGKLIPYIKDVIVVLLFFILTIFFEKTRKTAFIYMITIIYGTIILFINQCFDIGYIISGLRAFSYFFVTIMYGQAIYKDKSIFEKIYKVLKYLIIIEFIIITIQVIYSGKFLEFGNGGYRFCGTFGNAIGMANFTVAASVFITIYNHIQGKDIRKSEYAFLIMNLLLSLASGTRTAIFLNIIIVFIFWNYFSFSNMKIKKEIKVFIFAILGVILLQILYFIFIYRIGRGSLTISGGIRMEILLSFFKVENKFDILKLIFGRGIGFATNTAYLLKIESAFIADGTISTIIAQFGLLGLAILFIKLFNIINNLWKYTYKNLNVILPFLIAIIGIMISQNIFEQIATIILITVSYFMVKNNYFNLKNNEKNMMMEGEENEK